LDYAVRRVETRAELCAWLADGPVDVVVAAEGAEVEAILEVGRKVRPEVPFVVVARSPSVENAVNVLRRGATNYVMKEHLDRLAGAVMDALNDGRARTTRIREEAERSRLYGQAVEATRRRDAFLARVGHELRAPLNSLVGWTSMLRTRRLDDEGREQALAMIENCARAQARMLEDLIDMSRILTGSLRLKVQEIDTARLLTAAIEAARSLADANDIRITAEVDPTAGKISGDPGRLHQVFSSLLSNAIRFGRQGGSVGVRLVRCAGGVEVAFTDAGQGIAADELPHLFEKFRSDGEPRQRGRNAGLGMGLPIARHLVEAHGGTLEIVSRGKDQGATVTLVLPELPSATRSAMTTLGSPSLRDNARASWRLTAPLTGGRVPCVPCDRARSGGTMPNSCPALPPHLRPTQRRRSPSWRRPWGIATR
jgi:signal transduction histidine kinase